MRPCWPGQKLLAEGRLAAALGDSLITFLGGYGLSILVAIPVGLVMGVFMPVGKTLEVYVYALAAMPRVAFIPLIIVFLGLGFQAKIFIVFLGAVMPILINTYAGVLAVDEELIEMARSVRAGRLQIFSRIVLPGAVPFIIVGLRLGATIGLINTVVAELYTAVRGLGRAAGHLWQYVPHGRIFRHRHRAGHYRRHRVRRPAASSKSGWCAGKPAPETGAAQRTSNKARLAGKGGN